MRMIILLAFAFVALFASPAAAVLVISGTGHSERFDVSADITAPEVSLAAGGFNGQGGGDVAPGQPFSLFSITSGSDILGGRGMLADGRSLTFTCVAPNIGPCNSFVLLSYRTEGIAPAFTGATTANAISPFTFEGQLTVFPPPPSRDGFVSLALTGSGIATTHLTEFASSNGPLWHVVSTDYTFIAPAPEPATLTLVGIGLVAVGARALRRRRVAFT